MKGRRVAAPFIAEGSAVKGFIRNCSCDSSATLSEVKLHRKSFIVFFLRSLCVCLNSLMFTAAEVAIWDHNNCACIGA